MSYTAFGMGWIWFGFGDFPRSFFVAFPFPRNVEFLFQGWLGCSSAVMWSAERRFCRKEHKAAIPAPEMGNEAPGAEVALRS